MLNVCLKSLYLHPKLEKLELNLGISLPALVHTFTLSSIKCHGFWAAFHNNHYARG